MRSDDFSALWATRDVADCTTGTMQLRHPAAGPVSVDYQVWLQPDSPDHRLEVYTPNDPGSADALRLLTSERQPSGAAGIPHNGAIWPTS